MGMLKYSNVTKSIIRYCTIVCTQGIIQFKKYIWKHWIRILKLHTTLQKLISVHNGINVHPVIFPES